MIRSGVYKITCVINNKIYVGGSNDLIDRKKEHFRYLKGGYHNNSHLQKSWNKYGKDSFIFDELETCEIEKIIEREQHYLDTLLFAQEFIKNKDKRFKKLGFNISPTAGSTLGFKHTEESKLKMGLTRTGDKHYAFGKKMSKEHCNNMSQGRMGMKFSDEHLKNMSLSKIGNQNRLGVSHTKKTIKRIKKSLTGNKYPNRKRPTEPSVLRKPVVVVNIKDNKVLNFDTVKLAAEFFKVCKKTITNNINQKRVLKNHLLNFKSS